VKTRPSEETKTQETTMTTPEAVLTTWFDEIGPDGWYAANPRTDAMLAERFSEALRDARAGKYDAWILQPRSALALLVLIDQFGRNIHRDRAEAFAGDAHAVALAKRAINIGHDRQIPEPDRQFFYLPLMHAENQCDQDRCVRLAMTRLPETGEQTLRHAIAHRGVIREFGRFPFRNAALGRENSKAEARWLAEGGYRA
jgi:uncharacterized protein (DUF924 family)